MWVLADENFFYPARGSEKVLSVLLILPKYRSEKVLSVLQMRIRHKKWPAVSQQATFM